MQLNKIVRGANYQYKLVQGENGVDLHAWNLYVDPNTSEPERILTNVDLDHPLKDGTYLPAGINLVENGANVGKFIPDTGFQINIFKSEVENLIDLINKTNGTNLKPGQVAFGFPSLRPEYEDDNPSYSFANYTADEWLTRPIYNEKNTSIVVTGLAGSGFEGESFTFNYRRQVLNPILQKAFGTDFNGGDYRTHLVDFPVNNFELTMKWVQAHLPLVFNENNHDLIGWYDEGTLAYMKMMWSRYLKRPQQNDTAAFNIHVRFDGRNPNGENTVTLTADQFSLLYIGRGQINLANSIDSYYEHAVIPYGDYWSEGMTADEFFHLTRHGRYPQSWINRYKDLLNGENPNQVLEDEERQEREERERFRREEEERRRRHLEELGYDPDDYEDEV